MFRRSTFVDIPITTERVEAWFKQSIKCDIFQFDASQSNIRLQYNTIQYNNLFAFPTEVR